MAPSFRRLLPECGEILASVRDEHVQEVVKHFSLDASELTLVPVKKDDIENE